MRSLRRPWKIELRRVEVPLQGMKTIAKASLERHWTSLKVQRISLRSVLRKDRYRRRFAAAPAPGHTCRPAAACKACEARDPSASAPFPSPSRRREPSDRYESAEAGARKRMRRRERESEGEDERKRCAGGGRKEDRRRPDSQDDAPTGRRRTTATWPAGSCGHRTHSAPSPSARRPASRCTGGSVRHAVPRPRCRRCRRPAPAAGCRSA